MTLLEKLLEMKARDEADMAANPGLICFSLHTDIEAWNKSGIYTVEDLNAMLDAEHEREMRKQAMYGDYDDQWTTNADRAYFDALDREGVDHFYGDVDAAAEHAEWCARCEAEDAAKEMELAEYKEGQAWAKYQDGWI